MWVVATRDFRYDEDLAVKNGQVFTLRQYPNDGLLLKHRLVVALDPQPTAAEVAQHPILRRTDDLLLSFTAPHHPRNVTQSGTWNGETLIILGAKDDPRTPGRIARLHAGGITETGRYVPPRPFVGLSDRALDQVDTQVRAVLRQRLERLG